MLDLTNGGLTCSGLDAIEFFEMLAAGGDIDEDAKTEEFCNEYERALNRLRYEVRKSVPIPPKVINAKYRGHDDFYSCGHCGLACDRQTCQSISFARIAAEKSQNGRTSRETSFCHIYLAWVCGIVHIGRRLRRRRGSVSDCRHRRSQHAAIFNRCIRIPEAELPVINDPCPGCKCWENRKVCRKVCSRYKLEQKKDAQRQLDETLFRRLARISPRK